GEIPLGRGIEGEITLGRVIGSQQILLALESGCVVALDLTGKLLWKNQLRSPVNSVAFGDINGDGATEIVAGADDGHVCALNADGKLLWKHKMPKLDSGNLWALATPRVVRVRCADLDGDGRDEIVAGVGNLHLHVLAGDGRRVKSGLDWARTGLRKLPPAKGAARELWRRFSWGTWNAFTFGDLDGDGRLEIIGGPGMPPKAAASPGWILRADGEILAELDLDGWAGGINAVVAGDFAGNGKSLIALGTMKGYVRLYRPPTRLGEKIPLKPGQVVMDHTSGQNAKHLLRPPQLLWERNLGDLITGVAVLSAGTDADLIAAGSTTGYVTAFDIGGNKQWSRNVGSAVVGLLVGGRFDSEKKQLAIACKDGGVWLLDRSGDVIARTALGGVIHRMTVLKQPALPVSLLVADSGGRLRCLR
ncbi:MAG: VCBS repeat-containing protein, partial [Verrucomicrobia bacterium]|nr:VCBS repeat-containing protein [Verrucomicrobiota bacterium]